MKPVTTVEQRERRKVDCVTDMQKEERPVSVPEGANRAGEVRARWPFAEPSAWTDRMLVALEEGVKGGMWYSLHDKAFSVRVLKAAFQKVKSNGGAAGIDGWTARRFEADLDRQIQRLHSELMTGTYRPQPVKRVWIPKLGSKEKRPLGIPTIRDRIVQTAVRFILEPIYEKEFSDRSYGFRPGRSCHQALKRVWRGLREGNGYVVDADFRSFFDSIPHEVIMKGLESKIADGPLLKLLKLFLKQGIMEGMIGWTPTQGTPQGSALSPLLSNIALHSLDMAVEGARGEIVRYADDFVILCPSRGQADEQLERVGTWAASAGLELHPDKTRIVDFAGGEGFDFLGYHLMGDGPHPGKKSIKKLRAKVGALTRRSRSGSISEIVAELNPVIRGWAAYFKHSRVSWLQKEDYYIRKRLRALLAKRNHRYPHMCPALTKLWPNAYFHELGLATVEPKPTH